MDDLKSLGAIRKRVDGMSEAGRTLLRTALAMKDATSADAADCEYVLGKFDGLSAEGKALAAKSINAKGATAPEGTTG